APHLLVLTDAAAPHGRDRHRERRELPRRRAVARNRRPSRALLMASAPLTLVWTSHIIEGRYYALPPRQQRALTTPDSPVSELFAVVVGGAFTDIVVLDRDTGEVTLAKTPTTPHAPARGVRAAIDKSRLSLPESTTF